MSPKMEFFKGAQNFTMGNVEFNTVQGDYHDYSVRNVRNTYGNKNRYYTNNTNSFNDYSNNHAGNYHAPASHYYGTVNNVERVENANFGDNYGTINQGTTPKAGEGGPPGPTGPAGPGFAQGPPPSGPRPGPGPVPGDGDFTTSSTAVPQHQGFPQQRGPPPPSPLHRPPSGPPMPEANQAWQQQQQGPPPAFPPRGAQGYPQHPAQNPVFRPPAGPFPPPQPQQPPPPQQQQRQGSEQWPGQHAYKAGMVHLKQSSPASWERRSTGSSDTSDEDGSGTDEPMRREERQRQKGKMPEVPKRSDNVGIMGGNLGAPISIGRAGVTATAAGGTRLAMDYGAVQGAPPIPSKGPVLGQGPQRTASPSAPPSRGQTPQPAAAPATQRDPSPARAPSPQPSLQQQQPQQMPSAVPVPAANDSLAVPSREMLSGLAVHLVNNNAPRRPSSESSEEDDDAGPVDEAPSSLTQAQDKKKKKHRNPFSFLSSKKKK